MRKTSSFAAVCLAGLVVATAHAQDAAAPAPTTTTPATSSAPLTAPPPTAPPPTATTPPPPAPAPAACVPNCRSGFVCVNARCVSACNPPCGTGETCTADGRCTSPPPRTQTAPAAPPATSAAPAQAKPEPTGPRWATSYTNVARRDEDYEFVSANEQRRKGIYYHDGFYFRFGIGGGYLYGQASDTPGGDVTTSGIAVPLELAVGGTPVAGIVLGVGSYGLYLPALNYDFENAGEESADPGIFSAVGPFIDFYVRPAFGMHLQFAPTLVVLNPGKSDSLTSDLSGLGYGVMLGAGYEIWVSKQWGGGWLLRVQGASVTLEDEDGNEYDHLSITPSVLFTITLH